jgi:tellurium resistance protein TerZ
VSMSLVKGTPQSLVGAQDAPVSKLFVGVGWDSSTGDKKGLMGRLARARGVDLDLACLVYDTSKSGVRICGFDSMSLYSGALTHSGDNRTGKGDGIDESILAQLALVPSNISTLVFTLNAFKKGVSFAQVAGADLHLVDQSSGADQPLEVFSVPIDDNRKSTIFMAKVARSGDGWQVTVLNEMAAVDGSANLLQKGKRFV